LKKEAAPVAAMLMFRYRVWSERPILLVGRILTIALSYPHEGAGRRLALFPQNMHLGKNERHSFF